MIVDFFHSNQKFSRQHRDVTKIIPRQNPVTLRARGFFKIPVLFRSDKRALKETARWADLNFTLHYFVCSFFVLRRNSIKSKLKLILFSAKMSKERKSLINICFETSLLQFFFCIPQEGRINCIFINRKLLSSNFCDIFFCFRRFSARKNDIFCLLWLMIMNASASR